MPAVLVSWGCRTNDHKRGVKPTHTYSLTVWWPKSMAGFTALRSGCRQGRSPWSSKAEPGSLPCLGPGGCPPSTAFSPPASLVTSLLGCLHTPCASLFSANPGPSPHLKILILVVSAESRVPLPYEITSTGPWIRAWVSLEATTPVKMQEGLRHPCGHQCPQATIVVASVDRIACS